MTAAPRKLTAPQLRVLRQIDDQGMIGSRETAVFGRLVGLGLAEHAPRPIVGMRIYAVTDAGRAILDEAAALDAYDELAAINAEVDEVAERHGIEIPAAVVATVVQSPRTDVPREVVGVDARDLRLGDLVLAPGCEHRETPADGCEHRLHAAFDVEVTDDRVLVWVALRDRDTVGGHLVTYTPAEGLRVARALPDVNPADAMRVTALLPPVEPSCGPAGNLDRGGDLNSDWTCPSSRWAYWRAGRVEQVRDEVARLAELLARAEGRPSRLRVSPATAARRARNLSTWVLRAIVREQAHAARHPRPGCEHPAELRCSMSVAESLPLCSC